MNRPLRTAALAAAALLSLAVSSPARADDRLVVVELFTSQGCSSCPPADALMSELATVEGVLPLSLHVDYWDYIGWKDNFAQPAFTDRQRAYARAAGKRTIYTPQMIVQGRDHVVGFKPMLLADAIERRRSAMLMEPVTLSATRNGETVTIEARATGDLPPHMILQIVRFDDHERVQIGRGENAGRVVDYTNIVTDWKPVAEWDGRAPLQVDVEAAGDLDTAVLLQAAGPGHILAATRAH
ncbi:DUF1223 domain-containing protein [Celeribacter sp.]|uniref:DUF1223 domain-containing protein n=1 Tax=Celeribacter sp. TaxID=1890673 RepID=UPI003A941AB8